MASNPPGKCCFQTFHHEGTPIGSHSEQFGLNTYVTGAESSKVLVILTDVFGNKYNNTLLVADDLAKQTGFRVVIPDILDGDDIVDIPTNDPDFFPTWLSRHQPDHVGPMVDNWIAAYKKEHKPEFVGVIGYCFGAKYAVQQIAKDTGRADAAAIAHPSFVAMEEVAAIGKPIIISAAETDSIFPAELRHATETKLQEIGARYELHLFSGVVHGYAVRGDVSQPLVKYAKEKTLLDQAYFFQHVSN